MAKLDNLFVGGIGYFYFMVLFLGVIISTFSWYGEVAEMNPQGGRLVKKGREL